MITRQDTFDEQERLESLDAEIELMERIRSLLRRHMLPLCTLGAGEGSLAVRFLKLCHALRLEAGTFRLTSLLLKAIRTFHTDAGTEAGLASVQPFPLAGILPWFRDVEAADGKGPSETPKKNKNDAICRK